MIEFTPINGLQIVENFRPKIKEKEIERIYFKYFIKVCSYITCTEEKLGIGYTDGIIRFYNEKKDLLFWALQETKRNVGLNSVWYVRSILQSIMYLGSVYFLTGDLGVDNFKGIFLNSSRYFCFIPKSSVELIMQKFEPLWNKYYRVRPSEAYNVPELIDFTLEIYKDLEILQFSLNIKFRLDQLIRDLYENNI